MSSVFSSAVSGLTAAAARLSNAARNIANISSTGKLPASTAQKATSFAPQDVVNLTASTGEVYTKTIDRIPSYHPKHEPFSPDANAQGLVAEPAVDLAAEMVDMLVAQTVYQANAKVVSVENDKQKALLDTLA